MPHIGGDEFRAAWFALREAMRNSAHDVSEIRLSREGASVRVYLTWTGMPSIPLEDDPISIGNLTVKL